MPTARTATGWIAAWVLVGAAYGVSFLGAASIGCFLLPVPVVATVLLARVPAARSALPAVLCGLGLPLLYVAFLNRSGPGLICTTTSDGAQRCGQQTSPWPWLAVGLILIMLGAAAFVVWRRRPGPQQDIVPARQRGGGPV